MVMKIKFFNCPFTLGASSRLSGLKENPLKLLLQFSLFSYVFFVSNAPEIGGSKVQCGGSISRIDQYAWKYTSAKFHSFNKKCTISP